MATTRLQNGTKASAPVATGFSGLALQRKCACGGSAGVMSEYENCQGKKLSLQRSTQASERQAQNSDGVPPIVHEVLRSPGQPLNAETRAFFEPRLGHDFSNVRVHTDARANASARVVGANAYTVGADIVFRDGKSPTYGQEQRLLAHELAHVIQQSRGGNGIEAESRANSAAEQVVGGHPVALRAIGGANLGFYADNDEEARPDEQPTTTSPVSVDWDEVSDPTQLPDPELPPLPPPWLTFPPTTTPAPSPSLPSRLSLLSSGRFSLGIRLGFPTLEGRKDPDAPPSASEESMRQAEIMNQTLTGEIPTPWEAMDKGQLAKIIWSIFSTHVAPDVARSITSGVTQPVGPAGTSYELDVVITTDFQAAGLSFTAHF